MAILYHGSAIKLNIGDKLRIGKNYNHHSTNILRGVFATSCLDKAKYFGIVGCVGAKIPGSRRKKMGKKIYVEDIATNIQPKFYVYCVDDAGFILDADNEYICPNDVTIVDCMEFDLSKTFTDDGWQLFQTAHTDVSAPVAVRHSQMQDFVKKGTYRRVDITKLIFDNKE